MRLDLGAENQEDDVGESDSDDEDVYMEPQEIARLRARQSTRSYNIFTQFTTNPVMSFRKPARMFFFALPFYAVNL